VCLASTREPIGDFEAGALMPTRFSSWGRKRLFYIWQLGVNANRIHGVESMDQSLPYENIIIRPSPTDTLYTAPTSAGCIAYPIFRQSLLP
jgi:hypothetical protein